MTPPPQVRRAWLGPKVPLAVPMWVPWLMLIIAALEIPWAIYLTVSQLDIGLATDMRFAVAGMAITATLLSLGTVVLMLTKSYFAVHVAIAGLTLWLGTGLNGLIASPIGPRGLPPAFVTPLWLAVPGVALFGIVLWALLVRRRITMPIVVLTSIGLVMLAGMLLVDIWSSPHVHNKALVANGSVGWDVLDLAEISALLIAALSLRSGYVRWAQFGSTFAVALFVGDAWFNVVLSHGESFNEALFFLAVGELPTALICLVGVIAATRAAIRFDRITWPNTPEAALDEVSAGTRSG